QPSTAITRALPIKGWDEFLREGEAYLKTGHGAHAKGKKTFTPEILYNIIAMGIEKLVMAALMQRGALPYNHTMGDLVEAMESVFPAEIAGLKAELLDLDRYQEICDIDSFNIRPPAPEAIPGMLALAEKLRQLVNQLVSRTGEEWR
ncbi:MAG TPA: hypothetical protein VLA15_11325, partial [Desulfurivibrionaceae bacterium]|nr:hypothetical protein [Desulfurivibrionaceae bacterium]